MSAPQRKKYAAFISYRHLSPDMEIARALHKMLEHNLIRPDKSVPRNIRPVFLDTGELPTLESLDAGILDALENSECLFVICSPNLPLSKYCMREISYFKELHGGSMRRIYTLLVDGTPAESYPDILRTEIRRSTGEDGVEREETVEVEPLFADVRAPSIRESIKKLRKTEFLRLAAAYYGCTYDGLYQRRKRWLWRVGLSIGAGVTAAALGFTTYAHIRNLQYSAAKAATYASYARERIEEGDELLALTLCKEGWEAAVSSGSQRYMTALRSAAVQHDYKLRLLPVAPVMQSGYLDASDTVLYLSGDEATSITNSGYIAQFNDAKTGAVIQQQPQDLLKVNTRDMTSYVTISAVADDEGVLWDTVSLWSLEEHQLISRFPFRLSGRETPSYQLYSVVESPDVLVLMDGDEPVAWMDNQGNQLTETQGLTLMLETAQAVESPDDPYYISISRNRLLKNSAAATVRNQAGDPLLTLEGDKHITAFSPDWSRFAYIHDGTLTVYDTATWSQLSAIPVADGVIQRLYLLQDSHYALLTYRSESSWWYNIVLDWRTGAVLGQCDGYALVSDGDHSFYTTSGGLLTRYHYTDLDLTEQSLIIAQHGSLCLTLNDTQAALLDGDTGRVILQADCPPAPYAFDLAARSRVQASGDLSRILVKQADGLHCYDQTGALLWQTDNAGDCFALSADGKTAAWLDAQGSIQVASAADGTILYTVGAKTLAEITSPCCMAVSSDGLCICSDSLSTGERALWIPAGSEDGMLLEGYRCANLYENGTLILEGDSYVMDFALWDVKRQAFLYQPLDNTGDWCYSPKTGYLVRRVETSGNHGALELEVLRLRRGKFVSQGRIPLPDLDVTALQLDSAGEVLSFTAGRTTMVCRLSDLTPLLETTSCPLYYEDGRFWCASVLGGKVYSTPLMEGEALYAFAMDAITSTAGQRTLSLDEQSRYSFDE